MFQLEVIAVIDALYLLTRKQSSLIGIVNVFRVVSGDAARCRVYGCVTGAYQVATKRVRVCVELRVFHRDDKRDRVLIGCNTDKVRVNDSGHGV